MSREGVCIACTYITAGCISFSYFQVVPGVAWQEHCGRVEQLFLGVSAAGEALEVHCTGLDGEAAALQDCYDEEHALRMCLQVRAHSP